MIALKMATSTLGLFCTAVVFAVLTGFCSAGESCTPQEMAQEHLQKLAAANNELALNLHRKLTSGSSENVFFSPMSISTAFGILFYGARGNTAEELRSTLGYAKAEMPDDLVHETFHRFLKEVFNSESSDAYVLNSANSLLVDKHLDVVSDYKTEVERLYQASVKDVNFGKESAQVVQDVNSWVKDKTNGKIEKLLDELSPSTVMVILNAIYFKGTWRVQFEPKKTRVEPFYNNGLESEATNVPLMHMTAHLRYTSLDDFQALELPYKGDNISMVVLLPNKRDGLADLESSLTLDKFDAVLKRLFDTKVVITLPKFKAEFERELSDEFKSLGAKGIFQSGADFSGMSSNKNVFVSEVVHKAVVEVNEEGSEAAAVTGIISNRMRPIFDFVPRFKADHPFLYFIVEQGSRSDMILFMGRVNAL